MGLANPMYQQISEAVGRLEDGSFVLRNEGDIQNALASTLFMVKELLENTDQCRCDECEDRLMIVGKWLVKIRALPPNDCPLHKPFPCDCVAFGIPAERDNEEPNHREQEATDGTETASGGSPPGAP